MIFSPTGSVIAEASAGPDDNPTAARKISRPNWRRVALAPVGRLHTIGPVRSRQPSTMPTTSGPAATPSDRLADPIGIAISPTRKPSDRPNPRLIASTSLT